MKELLYSPPALIMYSLITMLFLYFSFPNLNLIHFPFNLIGLVVSLLGLILMGKSKKLFIKYKTPLKLEKSTFLIKEGVFSKTRNPMYVGMTTLILGLSVFSTNIIALFVGFAPCGDYKVIKVEITGSSSNKFIHRIDCQYFC